MVIQNLLFRMRKMLLLNFSLLSWLLCLTSSHPRLPAKTRLTQCCFKARPSSSTLAKTLKHHCLKPSCLLYTALLVVVFSGFTVIMGGHVTRLRGDWCPDRWPPGVLGHLNHLSPHDALKHNFTSLKADLILLQPKVLERKLPWNWLSNT